MLPNRSDGCRDDASYRIVFFAEMYGRGTVCESRGQGTVQQVRVQLEILKLMSVVRDFPGEEVVSDVEDLKIREVENGGWEIFGEVVVAEMKNEKKKNF
jgi:hypothetical protein